MLWADAQGLPAPRLAWTLLRLLDPQGSEGVRAGVSGVPVAAEVAARTGETPVTLVETGYERTFLAPHPLSLLGEEQRLLSLLEGVGVQRCGELAALSREAVEVRFGAAGSGLWRLARADDPRRLFAPLAPERPHASMDFVDYEVRSAERLLFTVNALLESVCRALRERGERARSLVLSFALSGGGTSRHPLRTALPTAERELWWRRLRDFLERCTLPDAVTGVTLQVETTEAASASQGDLFDRGFATRASVEEATARIVDAHGELFVAPEPSGHPLPEQRVAWRAREMAEIAAPPPPDAASDPAAEPCLRLQLLPAPRPIVVRSVVRRDHLLPTRYLDGRRWLALTAAGPDRVSGGHDEARPFAREYFRCVTEEGGILWIFRDALEGREGGGGWFLQGHWS